MLDENDFSGLSPELIEVLKAAIEYPEIINDEINQEILRDLRKEAENRQYGCNGNTSHL